MNFIRIDMRSVKMLGIQCPSCRCGIDIPVAELAKGHREINCPICTGAITDNSREMALYKIAAALKTLEDFNGDLWVSATAPGRVQLSDGPEQMTRS